MGNGGILACEDYESPVTCNEQALEATAKRVEARRVDG